MRKKADDKRIREIADFYGIRYVFAELEKGLPACMDMGTIYISDKYRRDGYTARHLCAHELGHYFLHDVGEMAAMSEGREDRNFSSVMKEYEANIFSIILMPQIMSNHPWEYYPPKKLNRIVYEKVMEKGS